MNDAVVSKSSRPLMDGRRVHGPESARVWVDGDPYVNFVGSSYLAMQSLAELHSACRRALATGHPWTQMRSAAYAGSDGVFDEVQKEGASYFGTETSVFLPTGYFCGLAAVAGLTERFDAIFIDALSHFSLFDAAKLSGLPVTIFVHADADALRDTLRIELRPGGRPLILTDGVFATNGRVPPLEQYRRLADDYGGQLFVDESHAYGVLGETGKGAAEHCGVEDAMHAGTLGKGFCAQGGLLPCSHEFALRVRRMPPVRGSGSGSPISALVACAAMRYAKAHPERRARLASISQRLKTGLRSLGLTVLDTPAPISSFSVGRKENMQRLQRRLFEDGFHVQVSDYIGSGPEGMVRLATYADHSDEDVGGLLAALRRHL
jgi:7-keto-8-aminopelargonate synthetase-like enzyme